MPVCRLIAALIGFVGGFALLGLAPLSVASAVDVAQNAITLPNQNRVFLDEQEYRLGSGSQYVYVAKGSTAIVEPARAPEPQRATNGPATNASSTNDSAGATVLLGNGQGLYQMLGTLKSDDKPIVVPPDNYSDRWLLLRRSSSNNDSVRVRVSISRDESLSEPAAYRRLLEGDGGLKIHIRDDHQGGSERAIFLAARETLLISIEGPVRLRVDHRVALADLEVAKQVPWQITHTVDNHNFVTWDTTARYDSTPAMIDGELVMLTSNRAGFIEIPEGRHELRLVPSRDVVMQVLEMTAADAEVAQRLLDSDYDTAGYSGTEDIWSIPGEEALAAINLGGDDRLALGLRQLAVSPEFPDAIVPLADIAHVRRDESSMPANLSMLADWLESSLGRWIDLPISAQRVHGIEHLTWKSKTAIPPGRFADRFLPRASLDELAAAMPASRFVRLDGDVTFTRIMDGTSGRLRLVVLGDEDARLTVVVGDKEILLESIDETIDGALDKRPSVSEAALGRINASGASNAEEAFAARVIELSLEQSVHQVIIRGDTCRCNWIAVQERLRRNPDPLPYERRVAGELAGGSDASLHRIARRALSAVSQQATDANLRRLDAINADLESWLRQRYKLFAYRTAPRPPVRAMAVLKHPTNSSLGLIAGAIQVLDSSPDPALRRNAIIHLTEALESSNEVFLAEFTLRGAMLHEKDQQVRNEAFAQLDARLIVAERLDDRVPLYIARLLEAPSSERLSDLVTVLGRAGDTNRANALGALLPEMPIESGIVSATSHATLVKGAAASRRLVNWTSGAAIETFVATADTVVIVAGEGPLRITAFPQHSQDTKGHRLNGQLVAISGNDIVTKPFFRNEPSLTIAAMSGAAPGQSVVLDLPNGGPWHLSSIGPAVDIRAESLATPQLDRLSMTPLTKPPTTPAKTDYVRIADDDDVGERTLNSLRASTLVNSPIPRRDSAAILARASLPIASDTHSAVKRMEAIVSRSEFDGVDHVALYSAAVRLEQDYPNVPELSGFRRGLDHNGRWDLINVVQSSAGIAFVEQDASIETGEAGRIRAAMVALPEGAQRALRDNVAIAFDSDSPTSRSLTIELLSVRPGYLAPVDTQILLEVDADRQTLDLNAGKATTHKLALSAGTHRVRLSLQDPLPDTWVAMTMLESGRPIPWRLKQRYHAASAEQPVVARLNGPGLLRISQAGNEVPQYRALVSGIQEIQLRSNGSETSFYRLHLRASVEGTESQPQRASTSMIRHPAALLDYPQVLAAPPIDIERLVTAVSATWSAGVELVQRRDFDDVLTASNDDQYVEFLLVRRDMLATGADWVDTRALVRERDIGNPVVGLSHRYDRKFASRGASGFVAASAFMQQLDQTNASNGLEHAINVTAGLSQRRTIGPRSSHTPSISLFARALSTTSVSIIDRPRVDQDIFTPYKAAHRYGYRIEDEWRYSPRLDTRLAAGLSLVGNENGSIDRLGLEASADRLFGPLAVRVEYRLRHFLADNDRQSSSTAQRIALDLDWRRFDQAWRHWSMGMNAVWDIDSQSLGTSLTLQHHFGSGQGMRDFRPNAFRFRNERRLSMPSPEEGDR